MESEDTLHVVEIGGCPTHVAPHIPTTTYYVYQLKITITHARMHAPCLHYTQAFLSPEEETALLAFADRQAGAHWVVGKEGMGRRVQHYGHRFDYASRGIDFENSPCPSLPWRDCPVFAAMVARMLSVGLLRMAPDQMTLNEYLPYVRCRYVCVYTNVCARRVHMNAACRDRHTFPQ